MADFQRNLWAPWRMEYIEGIDAPGGGCFLCRAGGDPAQDDRNWVLWRGTHTLTILNRFPYSSGHLLVAPMQHCAQPDALPEDVLLEIFRRVCAAKRVLELILKAEGFNIGMNLGRCAGAGLPGHLHVHVVPRWSGDTNFMAVLGDVKVIPASLDAIRRQFLDGARQLGL